MCVLCNQSVNPDDGPINGKVGNFKFDLSKYMSGIEKDPSEQPKYF